MICILVVDVVRHQQSHEDIPVSGTSTSGDEENCPISSYHRPQTLPTHVYKESLPSTIYRTGEARAMPVGLLYSFLNRWTIVFPFLSSKATISTSVLVKWLSQSTRRQLEIRDDLPVIIPSSSNDMHRSATFALESIVPSLSLEQIDLFFYCFCILFHAPNKSRMIYARSTIQ